MPRVPQLTSSIYQPLRNDPTANPVDIDVTLKPDDWDHEWCCNGKMCVVAQALARYLKADEWEWEVWSDRTVIRKNGESGLRYSLHDQYARGIVDAYDSNEPYRNATVRVTVPSEAVLPCVLAKMEHDKLAKT